MRFTLIAALATIFLALGCVEPQDHGHRDDAGSEVDPVADGGGEVDARVPPADPDAGTSPMADAGTTPADAGEQAVLPPILDIGVTSFATIMRELVGGELRPTLVEHQTVSVRAIESDGSGTLHPSGTLGPCDLFPPVGTGSWPPSSSEPATLVALPPEYVTITADGASLSPEAGGDEIFVRAEAPVGSSIVVTVTYPGHAPIRREIEIEAPLGVTTPENQPGNWGYLDGALVRGDDLALTWPVDHVGSAVHTIDLTGGSRGSARCTVDHGDGALTVSASDLAAHFVNESDASLAVNMNARTPEETTVEGTRVRVRRSWGMPSLVLRLVD